MFFLLIVAMLSTACSLPLVLASSSLKRFLKSGEALALLVVSTLMPLFSSDTLKCSILIDHCVVWIAYRY